MTWQQDFTKHLMLTTTVQLATARQIVSQVSVFDAWLPTPSVGHADICFEYGKPAIASSSKISKYFASLFDSGKSSDFRHHIKSALKKYYNWLLKAGAIKESPEINVVIRRAGSERGQSGKGIPKDILTLLNEYLGNDGDDRERLIISCLSSLGVRAHELLGLRPDDFARNDGIVNVTSTKTEHTSIYGGQRYMVSPPSIFDAVENYAKENGIKGSEKLFPIKYRRLNAIVNDLARKAGVSSLKMHGFRHNCVTLFCSETGEDGATPIFLPTEISKMFGMSIKTVMGVYYHPSTEVIAAKALNSGVYN